MDPRSVKHETSKEYAWEPDHAKGVACRRKKLRNDRANARRKAAIAMHCESEQMSTIDNLEAVQENSDLSTQLRKDGKKQVDATKHVHHTCRFRVVEVCGKFNFSWRLD